MKKLQLTAWPKCGMAALFGASALLMVSCAQDGFDDDESWESSVANTQMTSPSADQIEITPSADGMSMTISWPVVMGAGGYELTLSDVSDASNPVVILSTVVDGCSVENVPREEDMNYLIALKTLGNSSKGNTTATTTTEKVFSTFTETTATIPDGSDLAQWFAANPVPDSEEMLYYDLVGGGSYTLDAPLDFAGHKVTLRSNNKNNRPTVTYGTDGVLSTDMGFGLKYVNFDCAKAETYFFATSATPTITPDAKGFHIINDPVTIQFCNISDVRSNLINDNKTKYCIKTFLMNNCVVKLASNIDMLKKINSSGTSIINMYNGNSFINDLSILNSTIYNSTSDDADYFFRYANNMNCNQLEVKLNSSSVTISNCTLYNLSRTKQMANWSGIGGKGVTVFTITSNIFVDCGNKNAARRLIVRAGANAEEKFNYNTYYFDGADVSETESNYDKGTILTTDPGFADAAGGDFTISGAEQLANKTGDPRWIK